MLNSIYRVLVRSKISHSIPNVRFSPFSSVAPKSMPETANDKPLISNYLINEFGFSQKKASVASKYLNLDSTEKPESIHAFLKSRGFTADQIRCIVGHTPRIIRLDLHKILMPKIEFFESSGFSHTEVNNVILKAPDVLLRSLENQIVPCFNYIKSFFDSTGTSVTFTKRLAQVLCCNLESQLIPNIEMLRDVGVPDSRIVSLMQNYPRTLMVDTEKFRKVVKEVKEMDLSPGMFILAVRAIMETSKVTWEKKVAVYKKWGFSENDVSFAIRKQPSCMLWSADKINATMDFLVNDIGLDYSFVVRWPNVMCYSLVKRLKPRYSIYKILVANGLIKKGSLLNSSFSMTERDFLKKVVQRYEKEVPGLLESYQKNLVVS